MSFFLTKTVHKQFSSKLNEKCFNETEFRQQNRNQFQYINIPFIPEISDQT